MNFGICEAAKDPPVSSFITGDLLAAFKGADEVGQPSSRRNRSTNTPFEGHRHSTCVRVCVCVCAGLGRLL